MSKSSWGKQLAGWITQTRILSPDPSRPWIKLREWDGRYFVDSNELARSQEFQDQCMALRKKLEER